MPKPKRPWKLQWWDQEYCEVRGRSFATRAPAYLFGLRLVQDGYWDVKLWCSDTTATMEYLG